MQKKNALNFAKKRVSREGSSTSFLISCLFRQSFRSRRTPDIQPIKAALLLLFRRLGLLSCDRVQKAERIRAMACLRKVLEKLKRQSCETKEDLLHFVHSFFRGRSINDHQSETLTLSKIFLSPCSLKRAIKFRRVNVENIIRKSFFFSEKPSGKIIIVRCDARDDFERGCKILRKVSSLSPVVTVLKDNTRSR